MPISATLAWQAQLSESHLQGGGQQQIGGEEASTQAAVALQKLLQRLVLLHGLQPLLFHLLVIGLPRRNVLVDGTPARTKVGPGSAGGYRSAAELTTARLHGKQRTVAFFADGAVKVALVVHRGRVPVWRKGLVWQANEGRQRAAAGRPAHLTMLQV